jgi:hypothetical protein
LSAKACYELRSPEKAPKRALAHGTFSGGLPPACGGREEYVGLSVITVSCETVDIVAELPKVEWK